MFRRLKDAVKGYVKGFSQEEFTEKLCAHLQEIGIDAEAVPLGSPEEIEEYSYEYSSRNIDGTTTRGQVYRRNAGCVTVTDRNFDMVQGVTWIAGGPDGSDRMFGLDFMVRGNVSGLEEQLEAEAKEKKKGFIRRRLVDVTWEGGRLADLLNGDDELRDLLIKAGKGFFFNSPRIRPDKENQYVRVSTPNLETTEIMGVTANWKFPSKEYVEACDRIATHIRTLL